MAYALVGTIGAVTQAAGAGSAVTPAWGTSETRVANNLLICWVSCNGIATIPTTPAGWSIGITKAGGTCSVAIFYKIAAGSDAAPTIAAVASGVLAAQLAEFSGNLTASPLDKSGSTSGTTSPLTATANAVDSDAPELVVYAASLFYTAAAAKTITPSLNNGMTVNDSNNAATSTAWHYDFGYALNGRNAAADAYTVTYTTTSLNGTGFASALASFKLPPHLQPAQAHHRTPRVGMPRRPSRGRF